MLQEVGNYKLTNSINYSPSLEAIISLVIQEIARILWYPSAHPPGHHLSTSWARTN